MYTLTQKTAWAEGKEYTVYGIRYNDEIFAEDITVDKAKIERLVKLCNRHSLDPIHFYDVVEDFLAE